MAPTQQQLLLIAQAKRRRAEAGEAVDGATVQPLGGAKGEWDLSKFEALPRQQTAPATINAPNPITTAVQQSQVQAGNTFAANKQAELARQAEASRARKESAAAFGGGMDLMPTEDAGGNVMPGTDVDRDVGKFIIGSPVHTINAGKEGVQSILNLPLDAINSIPGGRKIPTLDVPDIPLPKELDSNTAQFAKPLLQFLITRKIVGSVAPGGGSMAQRAKDAATGYLGFEADTPRLSEMANEFIQQSGSPQVAKDFIGWMASRDPNNPILERFKNAVEFALPEEIVRAGGKGLAMADRALTGTPRMTPTNAGGARPGPVNTPPPSAAPVTQTAVPQTPPRAAQASPAAPGQQPTAGPAPAAPGVTGGQGGGVLNAVPAAPVIPKGQIRVAKDTAKILSRIMRSSRIKDADITGYLPGAVQRYKGLNDPSVPFAFFLEGDLPQHFPQPIAEEVVTKLQTWGRERNAATGPQDTSRRTIQQTVKTLREGQQDYLSGVMDQNLYKGKLIGQEDKLKADLKANAKTAYDTALQNANNGLLSGRATVPQRDALGKIQELLHNDAFLKQVPQHLRIKAMREGIDLEDFVQKDPLAAAHWLQSELRQAVSAAEGVGGSATSESRLYGEMRQALLDQLETAVPGYKGARKAHGDIYGAVEALDFGNSFFKAARSEVETARLARQFKALSKRQQTAATMSIRDALKNEFRNKAEDTAAKVTRLQQAGVLEALETVLGADGKRVADGIRNIVKQNDRLKAIDQGSGSPTYSNQRGGEAAREMVQSPVNKAVGAFGDKTSWPMTVAGDVVLASSGLPPVLTAGKAATALVDRFGNPSAKQLSRATEGLYGLPAPPPANALSGPPSPRGGRPRVPAPPPTQQTLDDLLREYDAIDHRKEPGKAAQVLKKIDALKKKLAKAEADASALSAPPSPPVKGPVNKAGFFGSGSKPLDMSEAGAGIREIGGGGPDINRYAFDAAKGYRVEVGVLGDGSVHFGTAPNHYASGVGGTQGAGQFTGAEAGKILRGVQETIALDAQKTGRARYVLEPQDQRMQSLVQKAKPPAGYTAKQTQWGVEFVLDPSQSGSSKLLAGMGGSEGAGAVGGGALGYATAPDQNGDGVVDAREHALGAIGGAISGPLMVKGVKLLGKGIIRFGDSALPPEYVEMMRRRDEVNDALKSHSIGYWSDKDSKPWVVEGNQTHHRQQAWFDTLDEAIAYAKELEPGAGVNALKGGAKAAERVPEQSGFFSKGPPKPPSGSTPIRPNSTGEGQSIEIANVNGNKFTGTLYNDPAEGISFHPNYPSEAWNELGDTIAKKAGKVPSNLKRMITPEGPGIMRMSVKKTEGPNWSEGNINQIGKDAAPQIDEAIRNRFVGIVKSNPGARKYVLETHPDFTSKDTRKAIRSLARDTDHVLVEYPDDSIALVSRPVFNERPGYYLQNGKVSYADPSSPPPRQNGFFSGGKGTPPDAPKTELQRVRAKQEILPADPKAPEGKPGAAPYRMTSTRSKTPISLARKEDALRKEVTNARRSESRARSSDIVIRDDRDAIIKSKWDRRVRAEKRLDDYLERRAKREAFVSGLQDFAEKGGTGKKIAIGAATGTALMAGGYALSALSGKHEKGGPTDPRDPKFYWEEIVSKDESLMSQIQTSLDRDWGLWPKEVAVTGRKGKTTKAAIWHWRKERGLNPDDPMSKADVARLLAGPKGYQDKKSGDWHYARDGSAVQVP